MNKWSKDDFKLVGWMVATAFFLLIGLTCAVLGAFKEILLLRYLIRH